MCVYLCVHVCVFVCVFLFVYFCLLQIIYHICLYPLVILNCILYELKKTPKNNEINIKYRTKYFQSNPLQVPALKHTSPDPGKLGDF